MSDCRESRTRIKTFPFRDHSITERTAEEDGGGLAFQAEAATTTERNKDPPRSTARIVVTMRAWRVPSQARSAPPARGTSSPAGPVERSAVRRPPSRVTDGPGKNPDRIQAKAATPISTVAAMPLGRGGSRATTAARTRKNTRPAAKITSNTSRDALGEVLGGGAVQLDRDPHQCGHGQQGRGEEGVSAAAGPRRRGVAGGHRVRSYHRRTRPSSETVRLSTIRAFAARRPRKLSSV